MAAESTKGRIWLIIGAVAGIAIGIGKLPYFAGAALSLSDTAERIVGTAGLTLARVAARHGSPHRVVEGFTALLSVLVPGAAALLLVIAARASLRLRFLIGLLVAAVGLASFAYLPHGDAMGVAVLALFAAAVTAVATGPLVATPLVALAALIGTTYLPRLLAGRSRLPHAPVASLHEAIFASPGAPLWLRVVVLVVATLPFAWAARLVLR